MLSGAEENGAHRKVHLVDKESLEVLADRIDAAAKPDVLALGRGKSFFERRVNSVVTKWKIVSPSISMGLRA